MFKSWLKIIFRFFLLRISGNLNTAHNASCNCEHCIKNVCKSKRVVGIICQNLIWVCHQICHDKFHSILLSIVYRRHQVASMSIGIVEIYITLASSNITIIIWNFIHRMHRGHTNLLMNFMKQSFLLLVE